VIPPRDCERGRAHLTGAKDAKIGGRPFPTHVESGDVFSAEGPDSVSIQDRYAHAVKTVSMVVENDQI